MKYFYLVWSNLKRKKLRTFFTIASVTMAFLLFGFLGAIQSALSQGVDIAGADRLITRHSVSIIQTLPISYHNRILGIEGVASVMHNSWFGGIYQEPKNFFAQIPLEPEQLYEIYPEYLIDEETRARWAETRTGAVVGRVTADRFGWQVGDRIPIQATIWPKKDGGTTWEFEIVGIFEGAKKGVDTSQFFFRYDYFDEARIEAGQGQVGWYVLRVNDPDQATRVAREIDELFANSFAETKTETEGAFMVAFANQIGDIGAIITFILSAVFFTILLVAGNTMSQSVRERTGELAVLKALGFTHGGVLGMVLAESVLLCSLGGGLGLLVALGAVSSMDVSSFFPVFFIPDSFLILGVCLILAMGLATGLFPAIEAMRLRIADGLRR